MIGRSAPLSLATICGGVPAGATTPAQGSRLKPLIPASSMVGRSGNSVLRRIRDTAMGRTVPALTCGMALVKSASIIDTRPPIISSSAGIMLDGLECDDPGGVAAGIGQLAGIGLGVVDHLLDRMDRQFWIDDQHQGEAADSRDRHEILHRIVVEVLMQIEIGGEAT